MSRLRVALDARRLQDRPLGGVGRYLSGVVDLIATEVDLLLLTDARRCPVESGLEQEALRLPPRTPEVAWIQYAVPRWLRRFDGVFHGSFNQLPFRLRVPAVVSIYDLSFEVHPEGFGAAKRRVFQVQARHAARVAQRIHTLSASTRNELVECYRVPPERITVTPCGVDSRFKPARVAESVAVLARLGVAGRYVVAMGGAQRRGLDVAVRAWRQVRSEVDVTLVVVGSERAAPERGLVNAGSVDDDEWPALLAGADAFCYPTRYEGFGFPALESIASGTPVVCAPVGSLPEVLTDAAAWCKSPTVTAIAAGLRRVLEDRHYADELRHQGLLQAAAHPSWEHNADVMIGTYREAYGP